MTQWVLHELQTSHTCSLLHIDVLCGQLLLRETDFTKWQGSVSCHNHVFIQISVQYTTFHTRFLFQRQSSFNGLLPCFILITSVSKIVCEGNDTDTEFHWKFHQKMSPTEAIFYPAQQKFSPIEKKFFCTCSSVVKKIALCACLWGWSNDQIIPFVSCNRKSTKENLPNTRSNTKLKWVHEGPGDRRRFSQRSWGRKGVPRTG